MEQFYKTHMGRKFYESDVPKIVTALEKIAVSLEKINKRIELEAE